jgi:hypothetical protein
MNDFIVGSTAAAAAASALVTRVANSSAITLARGGAAAAAAAGVSGALSFLPTRIYDVIEPSRNFSYINLKDNTTPSLVAFGSDDSVFVLTTSGYFMVYSIPPQGGLMKLEREHVLLEQSHHSENEAMGAKIHMNHSDTHLHHQSNQNHYQNEFQNQNQNNNSNNNGVENTRVQA